MFLWPRHPAVCTGGAPDPDRTARRKEEEQGR